MPDFNYEALAGTGQRSHDDRIFGDRFAPDR